MRLENRLRAVTVSSSATVRSRSTTTDTSTGMISRASPALPNAGPMVSRDIIRNAEAKCARGEMRITVLALSDPRDMEVIIASPALI